MKKFIINIAHKLGIIKMPKLAFPTPFDKLAFSLDAEQIKKLNEWHIKVTERAAKIQADTALGKKFIDMGLDLPHYGAIGGALIFSFAGSSLGTVCKVKEVITGEEIDLTDYDKW